MSKAQALRAYNNAMAEHIQRLKIAVRAVHGREDQKLNSKELTNAYKVVRVLVAPSRTKALKALERLLDARKGKHAEAK